VTPVVGDEVPALVRAIEAADMVAYAGATWDWHRLHYDHEWLTQHDLTVPVVDGQLFGALLVEAVQDWLGPSAMVRRLSMRFRSPVLAGETVRCTGRVTQVDGRLLTVEQQVEVVGSRVAVSPAGSIVELLP
jgi:acyl dehydratase